jgi:nitronate monooxygenase
MLRTWLTDRFELTTPVVSAPMAGVAGGRLAAAVSAAGGLGMIGVGSTTPPEFIEREARIPADAGLAFGVGLMAWALERSPEQLEAAIAAGPALVSVSFGDYRRHIAALQDAGITVATQVADADEAAAAAEAGVDVVVARGAEAGGHGLARLATLPLLQAVLERVDVPVLAAGGIGTGRGLAAVLAAGAAGAWMGTALLACPEAANSPAARARRCAAAGADTVYTQVFDVAAGIPWPAGYGGRALSNAFSDRWHGHEAALADDAEARQQLAAAKKAEDYDVAVLYAGQGVGSVAEQRPAGDVLAAVTTQAEELLQHP